MLCAASFLTRVILKRLTLQKKMWMFVEVCFMFAYRLVLWNCFEKGSMRRVLKSHLCVCVGGLVCV